MEQKKGHVTVWAMKSKEKFSKSPGSQSSNARCWNDNAPSAFSNTRLASSKERLGSTGGGEESTTGEEDD